MLKSPDRILCIKKKGGGDEQNSSFKHKTFFKYFIILY